MIDTKSVHNSDDFSVGHGPWYSHEYIAYATIMGQPWLFNLPAVPIVDNPGFGDWEIGPNHVDLYKELILNTEFHNVEDSYDCRIRKGDFSFLVPPDLAVAPWKIMVLYSSEPDLDLDCDLNLSKKQKITGGSHGFRHMSIKLFGKKIGELPLSFDYYIKTARRAFKSENYYWAWRFLARSSHYLADLGHPFHNKLIPIRLLPRLLFRDYKNFETLLVAFHSSHEAYTLDLFRKDYAPFNDALTRGSKEGFESHANFDVALTSYRKNARKYNYKISKILLDEFREDLLEAYSIMHDPSHKKDDLVKVKILAAKKSIEVFHKHGSSPGLKRIRDMTADLLHEVGYITGMMYRETQKFLDYSCE